MKSLVSRMLPKFAKKKSLADFSLTELNRQQLVLDSHERNLTRKIEAIERQKDSEFKNAVANGSDRQRLNASKKIQELDRTLNQCDAQLAELHSNRRFNSGIIRLKENAEFRERVLGGSNNLDITSQEIRDILEKESIEIQVRAQSRDGLLEEFENHGTWRASRYEDAGHMDIYRQMLLAAEQQFSIPSDLPAQNEIESTKDVN
jgi:hypothetical protein